MPQSTNSPIRNRDNHGRRYSSSHMPSLFPSFSLSSSTHNAAISATSSSTARPKSRGSKHIPPPTKGSRKRSSTTGDRPPRSVSEEANETFPMATTARLLPNVFEFLDEEDQQDEDETNHDENDHAEANHVSANKSAIDPLARHDQMESHSHAVTGPDSSCHSDSGISMEDGSPQVTKRRLNDSSMTSRPQNQQGSPYLLPQQRSRSRRWSQESKAYSDISAPEAFYLPLQQRPPPMSHAARNSFPHETDRHSYADFQDSHMNTNEVARSELDTSTVADILTPQTTHISLQRSHTLVDQDMASSTCSAMPLTFRRFDSLNQRLLSQLQLEIAAMENDLYRLEQAESQCRHEHGQNPPPALHYQKCELLAHIHAKVQQYNAALASYAQLSKNFGTLDGQSKDNLVLLPSGQPQFAAATTRPSLLFSPMAFLVGIVLLILAFTDLSKPLSRLVVLCSVALTIIALRERANVVVDSGALARPVSTDDDGSSVVTAGGK